MNEHQRDGKAAFSRPWPRLGPFGHKWILLIGFNSSLPVSFGEFGVIEWSELCLGAC